VGLGKFQVPSAQAERFVFAIIIFTTGTHGLCFRFTLVAQMYVQVFRMLVLSCKTTGLANVIQYLEGAL
jgi:hypothetical protein